MNLDQNNTQLPEMSDDERLRIYDFLISGCAHLFSKNAFQPEKFATIAPSFMKLAKEDPYFLAHFTAWAMKQDSKDLKVLSVYFNFLNDANGEPFFLGSTGKKPNLRLVSSALLQELDPLLAARVLELSRYKFEVPGYLTSGAHYPSVLKTAFRKYLLYRELHLDMVRGIKNKGLGSRLIKLYKLLHLAPSIESASILNWKQKGRALLAQADKIDFKNLSSDEIAKEIMTKKLSPIVALSAIPKDKFNYKVAEALLKNSTGNQVIILQNMFRTKGFLEIDEINSLFVKKLKTAGTAVDRIDTLSKNLTEKEKAVMSDVRSTVRKNQIGNDICKIYLHIDKSSSMNSALDFARNRASIIAECIPNPEENFSWGLFGSKGYALQNPTEFKKENFFEKLYGVVANDGSTDCLACYEMARTHGAEVDIYITDQDHNVGDIVNKINYYTNRGLPKPKGAVIINFGGAGKRALALGLERAGIPVEIVNPNSITESALVSQVIKSAVKGRTALLDEVMNTKLPSLPKWWNSKELEDNYKIAMSK